MSDQIRPGRLAPWSKNPVEYRLTMRAWRALFQPQLDALARSIAEQRARIRVRDERP